MSQVDVLKDVISLISIDNDGKQYDHLTRGYFSGTKIGRFSPSYVIDINTSLYPIKLFSKYQVLLSKSEECKGDYDYVMNGHVYKINDQKQHMEFYISFGGLLLQATVSSLLTSITLDDTVYLMIRNVQ
jgi:hypothetical protein